MPKNTRMKTPPAEPQVMAMERWLASQDAAVDAAYGRLKAKRKPPEPRPETSKQPAIPARLTLAQRKALSALLSLEISRLNIEILKRKAVSQLEELNPMKLYGS